MLKRIGGLVVALALRMLVGGWLADSCQEGQRVRVAGIIDRVEQTGSNQIIWVGQFRIKTEAENRYLRTEKIVVTGRCQRRVTDFLLSRIWLTEPSIEVGEKNKVAQISWLGVGRSLQGKLVSIYQKQLPEPEASLVAGIVLGAKSNLTERFYQALINTGTVHVVVASGYNLTVVSEIVFYILIYFVHRKWASLGAIGVMFMYAWMTGFGVPVVRALIMASLVLIAKATGRVGETAWWLTLTVWAMLIWSTELIESVSFQLSVAATSGLVWVEPRLREVLDSRSKILDLISKTELAPTLSAQIATAPIIWWHFGRLSLISPVVNLLVLPLIPTVMLLGVLQLVFGWLIAPFSYSLLHLIVVIVNFFG